MAVLQRFCNLELEELKQLVYLHRNFMLSFSVSYFIFGVVATLGNLLVILALWRASSMPSNMKKMFLSLAFSDLAVGSLAQLMYGAIVMELLWIEANGNHDFESFCPVVLTAAYFVSYLLAIASFLTITFIAADRLLAVSLHLRYAEIATSRRVVSGLTIVWLSSGIVTSTLILLPDHKIMVSVITEVVGLFLTTLAYIRIAKVVRYHQRQIQSQVQNAEANVILQHKRSALNGLFVYIVFLLCYLPYLSYDILVMANSLGITSLAMAKKVAEFLVCLNSSLNPFVFCWRYREIRAIVKNIVKKILRRNAQAT